MEYARFRAVLFKPMLEYEPHNELPVETHTIDRICKIVCRNGDGSVDVKLGGPFDPHCLPEDQGTYKVLTRDEWSPTDVTHPLITKEPPLIKSENPDGRSITVKQPMSFGPAIELCKMGAKICRLGWNKQGMFIYAYRFPAPLAEGDPLMKPMLIMCVTAQHHQPGWFPSTADLFAEDWYLFPIKMD